MAEVCLLRNIINVMKDVFSPALAQAIIKKIMNKKNRKILKSLIKIINLC